jgi:hypothetical protein
MEWAFAICILYCIGNINTVTNSDTGLPLIEVYYLATGSKAVATVFIVAIAIVIFVALFNTFASVSRLTWAFARDHGLPFSRTFAQVSLSHRVAIAYLHCCVPGPPQIQNAIERPWSGLRHRLPSFPNLYRQQHRLQRHHRPHRHSAAHLLPLPDPFLHA